MTEAVRAVTTCGHGRFKLNRMEAWTLPGNDASDRVLAEADLIYEGTLKQKRGSKGAITTCACSGASLTIRSTEPKTQHSDGGMSKSGSGVKSSCGSARLHPYFRQYSAGTNHPLLSDYSEVVISAMHDHSGDVLKLVGDGTLAIFPTENREEACFAALAAAAQMRKGVVALTRQTRRGRIADHSSAPIFSATRREIRPLIIRRPASRPE